LVNCGLYGRGWNWPALDLIAWVRATQSTALWVQGTVRGTRTAPEKQSCLVLDFAGNIRRLGPINDPIIPLPRRKGDAVKGEAPVKECPQCFSYLHTRTMVCPDCGYVFPPPSTIKKTASEEDILKGADGPPRVEEFKVLGIRYKSVMSKRGIPYLKVTYSVGTHNFVERKFFNSDNSFAKRNVKIWWTFRGGLLPVPADTDEAIERADSELAVPTVIRVDLASKYNDVVGCDFDSDDTTAEKYLGHKPTATTEKPFTDDDFDDIPF
jgi:DNA repair protein RadD